jgi:hypothetical protein
MGLAPAYTIRFLNWQALGENDPRQWTVPEGKIHVVKNLCGLLHSPQAGGIFFGSLGETLAQFYTETTSLPDWARGSSFNWEGRAMFREGEKPGWQTLFNLTDIAITGFELDAF